MQKNSRIRARSQHARVFYHPIVGLKLSSRAVLEARGTDKNEPKKKRDVSLKGEMKSEDVSLTRLN